MRKVEILKFFGLEFEVTQFSAVEGLEILFPKSPVHPVVALNGTKIKVGGEFVPLKGRELINELLVDKAEIVPPYGVLMALLKLVDDINFGFLKTWKSVKVPSRFVSGARTVSSDATPSIIAQLIQDNVASQKELEEYYSLEDAFKMLDVMTAKGVNAAYAAEAAETERKQ